MKCVLDSSKLSGDGRLTDACQTLLEQRLGTPTALLTPSCTDALELAALLIDVGPGDEVILPSVHVLVDRKRLLPAQRATGFRRRSSAGALHARTGRVEYVEGTRKNSDLFLRLLEHLRRTCRAARQLILIVDNYIIHKWRLATAWLNHNPEFRLLFQPAYQPWVNNIERLCKQLHDNITRNHQYATIDPLMDAVRAFMQAASPFPGNCPSVARFGSRI